MNYALEVNDLTVSYPGWQHSAIDGVTFTVEKGVIAAIIGPNGSGKSTLLKAILGLIPYKGEIKVFGKDVRKSYKKIGYVPQRFSFDPTFPISVSEFISLAVAGYGDSASAHKSHVANALKSVNAEDLYSRRLSSLSGGQLQRVLLARAVVHNPELLLLDEPESGVDVGGEQTFYDLVESMVKKNNITVLVASHELDVVYAYSSHVLCLNRTLVCNGVPKEVLDQDTFVKLYGRGLKFYAHGHR